MRYRSDDPLFARYEEAVTAVVAARGATLWAGPALDERSAGLRARLLDRVVEHPVRGGARRGDVLAQRGHVGDEVPAGAISSSSCAGSKPRIPTTTSMWELRQTVWSRAAR